VDQYIGDGLGELTDELGGNYMNFWLWIYIEQCQAGWKSDRI